MTDLTTGADAGDGADDDAAASAGSADAGAADTSADTGNDGAQGGDADAGQDGKAAEPDWRDRLAGDDDKLRGFLGRYQSEKAFVEAAKKDREAARSKLGGKLPENPSDEELAEYRKQNQIPDDPAGYLEKLPDGLVVGEDDRPFVDVFLGEMHALNATPELTGAALKAYYNIVDDQAAAHSEAVAANKRENDDLLREEWGADYRRNVNVADAFLATLPAEVSGAIVGGMDDKGMPLGANAAFVKFLTGLALEANPLATVVPGAGANQASAVQDEIDKIEGVMRTNRTAYNQDEKMQARLLELYDARTKLENKG